MNILRLILACVWTIAWGLYRYAVAAAAWENADWACRPSWRDSFVWGRRESPKPVRCTECGWTGPGRWAKHTYRSDGFGDVDPVDECPRCREQESLRLVWRSQTS